MALDQDVAVWNAMCVASLGCSRLRGSGYHANAAWLARKHSLRALGEQYCHTAKQPSRGEGGHEDYGAQERGSQGWIGLSL